jgi:hypothetical protein
VNKLKEAKTLCVCVPRKKGVAEIKGEGAIRICADFCEKLFTHKKPAAPLNLSTSIFSKYITVLRTSKFRTCAKKEEK